MRSRAARQRCPLRAADAGRLVGALSQQAQLMTAFSAFLRGCGGTQERCEAGDASGPSTGDGMPGRHPGSAETRAAGEEACTAGAEARYADSEMHPFWAPVVLSLRSIVRSASKVGVAHVTSLCTSVGARVSIQHSQHASQPHAARACVTRGTLLHSSVHCWYRWWRRAVQLLQVASPGMHRPARLLWAEACTQHGQFTRMHTLGWWARWLCTLRA
jgi:hypothetical protein